MGIAAPFYNRCNSAYFYSSIDRHPTSRKSPESQTTCVVPNHALSSKNHSRRLGDYQSGNSQRHTHDTVDDQSYRKSVWLGLGAVLGQIRRCLFQGIETFLDRGVPLFLGALWFLARHLANRPHGNGITFTGRQIASRHAQVGNIRTMDIGGWRKTTGRIELYKCGGGILYHGEKHKSETYS
jgi:hypothetical protein